MASERSVAAFIGELEGIPAATVRRWLRSGQIVARLQMRLMLAGVAARFGPDEARTARRVQRSAAVKPTGRGGIG